MVFVICSCCNEIHLFRVLVDLLGLLKWNSMVGKLKDILITVMKVSGEEIVKVCAQTVSNNFTSSNLPGRYRGLFWNIAGLEIWAGSYLWIFDDVLTDQSVILLFIYYLFIYLFIYVFVIYVLSVSLFLNEVEPTKHL